MLSAIMCHRAWRNEIRTEATESGRLPFSRSSWRETKRVSAE